MARSGLAAIILLGGWTACGPGYAVDALDAVKLWGEVGYQGYATRLKDEVRRSADLDTWRTAQEAFLTLDGRYATLGAFSLDFSQSIEQPQGLDRDDTELQVSELYFDPVALEGGSFALRLGRQRLRWGVLEFYHPIDTLEEPANPFLIRQVIEGLDAARASVIFSENLAGSALVIRDREEEKARYAVRLDGEIGGFDVNVGALSYFHRQVAGNPDPSHLKGDGSPAYAFFLETAGFLENLGLFGEMQLATGRNREYIMFSKDGTPLACLQGLEDTATLRAGVAAQYERFVDPKWKIRVEYFYDGSGFDAREARSFYDGYRQAAATQLFPRFGEFGVWSQHYAAFSASEIELADRLKAGVKIAGALDSGAALMAADLIYSFDNNNARIYLQYSHTTSFGDEARFPAESAFAAGEHALSVYISLNFSAFGGRG